MAQQGVFLAYEQCIQKFFYLIIYFLSLLIPTVKAVGFFYTVVANFEGGTDICNLPVFCRTDI